MRQNQQERDWQLGQKSSSRIRAELVERLRARTPDIERAIFARVKALSKQGGEENPAYVAGLRATVSEAIDYSLRCIEEGHTWPTPVPPGIARQARRAAREGIRLDTVMRRYTVGSNMLEEFMVADAEGVPESLMRELFLEAGPRVDKVLEMISVEYHDEVERTRRLAGQGQVERVLHLLEGGSLNTPSGIDYDFEHWHLSVILVGEGSRSLAAVLSERLGTRLLLVPRDSESVWAWLGAGGRQRLTKLDQELSSGIGAGVRAAVGEPRLGLEGWRQSHREAQVALAMLLEGQDRFVRARDVILLAGVLRDESLIQALRDTYLAPLEEDHHLGPVLMDTLRAYFEADGTAAAAAITLGVTRQTVQRRIRTVEEKIGQHVPDCHAELEVALQIDELNRLS